MKFKVAVFIIVHLFISNLILAQVKTPNKLDYIKISSQLLENRYADRTNQFLAELTLQNTSRTEVFPADGWELYFNFPREVISVLSGNVEFKFLQGDYSKMFPSKQFNAIQPGEQVRIQFVAKGFIQNKTDALSGLYFVMNKQTFEVNNFEVKPLVNSGVKNLTAEELFKKYENTKDLPNDKWQSVFPTPLSAIAQPGKINITGNFKIISNNLFLNEARFLAADFLKVFGKPIKVHESGDLKNSINFKKVEGLGFEEYELTITNNHIEVKATYPAGAFYGVKSLTSLFPPDAWKGRSKTFELKAQTVKDKPRFAYRSFMLDVARNFQSKVEVKKIIDLMSLYKLNTLHFHLNDDEGWRLEIPSLPELVQVGSKRGHVFTNENLQPSYGSGPSTASTSGTGHYAEADFIEILKYAAERHIQVIPEIETPGHARAAIRSMLYRYEKYSAMGDKKAADEFMLVELGDQSQHRSVQGFRDNIMNVALPSTYHFLETVVEDVIKAYAKAGAKLTTIHIGGDEVPNGAWQKSKAVNKLIADKVVNNVDDLWYYYLERLNEILKRKKLQLAGWEEVALRKTKLDGKSIHIVNTDFIKDDFNVYVWNTAWGRGSEDLAYKLANAGYKTILAPVTNLYFDLAYSKDNDETGLYWGGYVDTDKPFYFVPFDAYKTARENYLGAPVNRKLLENKERLTDFGKANIVGIQCMLWSEKVASPQQLDYMLFPKLLGFAERAWAPSPEWAEVQNAVKSEKMYEEAWSRFANVLGKRELSRLSYYKGGVKYRVPPVGLILRNEKVIANSQFPGLAIRYTLDGTEPTTESKLYNAPISFSKNLKFKAFSTEGRSSKTTYLHPKRITNVNEKKLDTDTYRSHRSKLP